ncbi:MFS transporter [Streptomyces sp. NPDC002553]|uniref:MFS transporter n=1 Tax=Streptomyces sp. NPDC002553 TaxID=3154417 RepID=UPI0033315B2A
MGDTHVGDTPARRHRSLPLALYLLSAVLVRSASGGASVGLVTLTVSRSGADGGATVGGVLAALLIVPNVAGPWMARWLQGAKDARLALASAFVAFGVALGGAALLYGRVALLLVALLITVGGVCGPLMTGGLSSRLALIVGEDDRMQRRAEGLDSATYGIGNIAGPAAVAALAAATSPATALVVLALAAVVGGLLLFLLPAALATPDRAGPAMAVRDALKGVVRRGALRRVMVATMLTSVSTGGVMVVAVVLGTQLRDSAGAGAALGAAYGVGNLAAALAVGVFPLRGEPERLTLRMIAVNAATIALCAVAPNYPLAVVTFALAGASSSVLFTATLAVRSQYSPPTARAQVFVIMAGFKMAMSAVGTALAGALSGISPRLVLALGALITSTAVGVALLDRRYVTTTAPETTEDPAVVRNP